MLDAFIGEIRLFACNFAPAGWALCDGSVLPIREHQELFQLIGTTYGGNGVTSFALPKLPTENPAMTFIIALRGIYPSKVEGSGVDGGWFVGEIRNFPFGFAPEGWAVCDGQVLAIGDFPTLYWVIFTTYGGDGQGNFAIPDFGGPVRQYFIAWDGVLPTREQAAADAMPT